MAELLPPDKQPIAASIDEDFKSLLDSVPKLNPDIDVATSDAEKAKLDMLLAKAAT